jgi:hypothetical protein
VTEVDARDKPPEPLLEAIGNLSRFHREHEKFYSQAPLRQAVEVQAASRALKSLAGQWSKVGLTREAECTWVWVPDRTTQRLHSLAALARCFAAAERALAIAVSTAPCCFLMAAILSQYCFSAMALLMTEHRECTNGLTA